MHSAWRYLAGPLHAAPGLPWCMEIIINSCGRGLAVAAIIRAVESVELARCSAAPRVNASRAPGRESACVVRPGPGSAATGLGDCTGDVRAGGHLVTAAREASSVAVRHVA